MALTFPRNLFMEMFVNNSWQSVMSYVRQTKSTPIKIQRGKGGEQGQVAPTTLTCTMENSTGNFTPKNPLGAWYGQIGHNTPWRFGLIPTSDTFSRVVSNGWGSTDTGEAYSNTGVGGTVQASDFNVTGAVGTQSVPVASAYRVSRLDTALHRDVDISATVTVAINDITGARIEPCNLILRRDTTFDDFYMLRVEIDASEVLTLKIYFISGGVAENILAGPVTVPGLVDSLTPKTITCRFQAEGPELRGKVFAPGAEPSGWHITVNNTQLTAAGGLGIRNGVAAGNTNTKPILFQVDNLEVRKLRFSGETSEIKPRWNTTHTDMYAEITASTILRRLRQGKTPLRSTLRRAYTNNGAANLVQYWPCEEGEDAKQIISVIDSNHMLVTGRPQYAQFTDFLSSTPLPRFNGSTWSGNITPYTPTGQAQLRFLIAPPKDEIPDNTVIGDLECTGTIRKFRILYRTGGGLSVNGYNAAGTLIGVAGGAVALNINGGLARVQLQLTQNGGNVDYGISRYDLTDDIVGGASGSIAGTFIIPYRFTYDPLTSGLTNTAGGHITIQSLKTSDFEMTSEFRAWRGETPISRLLRLGNENKFKTGSWGSTSRYPMGPQLATVINTLLQECQDITQGTMYESMYTGNTLILRPVNATHGQSSKLTLNYAGNQIVPPLQPNGDDQPIANDITAKRLVGGEYRITQNSGPLNVQDPWLVSDPNAVGLYDQQVPVNTKYETQLPDVASWALHLGTSTEERFPKVVLDMFELSNALQVQVLDLNIDERFTIQNLSAAKYFDAVELLNLGWTETYQTAYEHTIEFNTAPYKPYNVGEYVAITSTPPSTSKYSPTVAQLSGPMTTTTTVLNNSGSLWTTRASQFPFDIMVNGERMTVTNITGSGLPQTFTVIRSVNGVVKSHVAATKFKLFSPVYYGR